MFRPCEWDAVVFSLRVVILAVPGAAWSLPLGRRVAAGAAPLAVLVLASACLAAPAARAADPTRNWTSPGYAKIRPGIATETAGAPCTANFVFTDAADHVYIGQAAHCAEPDDETDTNQCTAQSRPIGTLVTLVGSGVTGSLAYSSRLAMRAAGEKDPATCAANDFALVRIPDDQASLVNPTVPVFGGPTGAATAAVGTGDRVYAYGNSNLRGGIEQLSPQQGVALVSDEPGWYHLVYLLTPGIPGDSGGPALDAQGRALGVVTALNVVPPVSNGLTDLAHALAYARAHSGLKGLELANGTERFAPP